uniref:hypothetical protein n=1 Tax=Streptomyces asoensis TaxID=249586 RepID=UPI003F597A92
MTGARCARSDGRRAVQSQRQVEALADPVAGEDVRGGTLGEGAAVAQQQGVGGARGERVDQLLAARQDQAARRFVQKQQSRLRHERSGDHPVLTDLFAEFVPALRKGQVGLLALTGLRVQEPNTADEAHEALVRAVADGDPEAAAAVLAAEPEDPFGG